MPGSKYIKEKKRRKKKKNDKERGLGPNFENTLKHRKAVLKI